MKDLKFFNTLTSKLEDFYPIDNTNIRMYVCGPTVYDDIHIGNARPIVVFDVLLRLLRTKFSKVTYVRNITDIDDKINKQALINKEPIDKLTARTTKNFLSDINELNTIEPDFQPKATEHINHMLKMISLLVKKGNAYISKGHVFFSVNSMQNYGMLSGRSRDELKDGARVEVNDIKNDPADFVLWKPSTKEMPGWDSEFGRGRPGWHIECSAMSEYYLGKQFDIHGGGIDLIFPHHENEIAQSYCSFDNKLMANLWMHNGYITVNGEKMSKSLGNFITLRQTLNEFSGEAIRYALISGHYRSPIDFNKDIILQAENALNKFYRAVEKSAKTNKIDNVFEEALNKDLNTPLAISRLHELSNDANRGSTEAANLLYCSGKTLGFFNKSTDEWFQKDIKINQTLVDELILQRNNARKEKKFKLADEIREKLDKMGVVIEDNMDGSSWRKKKL